MNRIQLLDNLTINKIAAGEVVERPASVVKELVENSIDAGATAVTIEVKEGGTTFIKVTDNGSGIAKDQVKTAFLRHATSKIQFVEDLERVRSLGFRGEALASIAAVSQVEIITNTDPAASGICLKIEGGDITGEEETAAVKGTSITVKNLFFNVPARKKFLKKPSTESTYITDAVNKAALAHPEVSFKYINNGNLLLHTPGTNDLRAVALFIFGKDFAKKMIELSYGGKTYSLEGLIGKPELSRANRTYEYLFINGRPVKSSVVSSAVEEAYKNRLMVGKFPVFILNLNIDLTLVDVNVHPAKLEVRFNHENEVFDFVLKAVSKRLESETLIPEAGWDSKNSKSIKEFFKEMNIPEPKQVELAPQEAKAEIKNSYIPEPPVIRHADEEKSTFKPRFGLTGYGNKQKNTEEPIIHNEPASEKEASKIDSLLSYSRKNADGGFKAHQEPAKYETASAPKTFFSNYKIIGQVFSTYWMIEQGDSLFVIDQHAAHERVLFEEFSNCLKAKSVPSQRLIIPERLMLSATEKVTLEANRELFERLGFEINIDGDSFELISVPFIFKKPVESSLLADILDTVGDYPPETIYDTKLDSIATMACKAAVKANDKLSYAEAEALIEKLLVLVNPFTCPHGRPTIIELTKYELEKKFKRIV